MLTLRRSAWIRWLPPIDSASPSPVTTQTDRSERLTARPVAIAGARPGIEGMPEVSREWGERGRRPAPPAHDPLVPPLDAQGGQERPDRGQHGVVAAAGAPAHLLVGGEVL